MADLPPDVRDALADEDRRFLRLVNLVSPRRPPEDPNPLPDPATLVRRHGVAEGRRRFKAALRKAWFKPTVK